MILELACFLGVALVLLLPGVLLAGWLELGRTPLDRVSHGAALGLAGAVYLGSLVSHFDLRWFYPVWGIFFLIVMGGFLAGRPRRRGLDHSLRGIETWVGLVILLVGVTRLAAVGPQEFPRGWDPSFHMILAEKIRLTHHAIYDWSPFEVAKLNYPTGSHVLIVLISSVSRVPMPKVFEDLIVLGGILTTAQMYTLSRHFSGDAKAALFATIAYGFWAIDGSLGYTIWGGLPNELGMLFFVGVLSIWMESTPAGGRIAAMALLYAALILAHHHVMIASAAVLGTCLAWSTLRGAAGTAKILLAALVLSALLDAFFLIPFAAHAATITSTHIMLDGELPLDAITIPRDRLGYLFCFVSVAGLALAAMRRSVKLDPRLLCGLGTLLILFVVCDYIIPPMLPRPAGVVSTVFTASRFLADSTYFLAPIAGAAAAYVWRLSKIPLGIMAALLLSLGLTLWPTWQDIATPPDLPDGFVAGCRWIHQNMPKDVIVFNHEPWTSYLTWRETIFTPMPISEPIKNRYARFEHLGDVFEGRAPADANLLVVQIVPPGDYHGRAVLWMDDSGAAVVRIWPK
jgi:hypothetical protein